MPSITPLWPQWLAASSVSLLALVITMNFTWNLSFSKLLSTQHELHILLELLKISCKVFGIILGTIAASLTGASKTIYTCGFICMVNSILLIFTTLELDKLLYVYLACTEIVLGVFICASPIYISEMSNPTIRGKLISIVVQGAVTGNFVGNLANMYLDPCSFGVIMFGISVLFLFLFYQFPPTPYYLISHDRALEAQESIIWYDRDSDSYHEIESLKVFFEANPLKPFLETIPQIYTSTNRTVFLYFAIIFAFQNLSGLFAILFQIDSLFNNSSVTIFNPHEVIISIGIITTLCSWMFFFLSDTFERDETLLAGFIALSIGIFSWGSGCHLIELGYGGQIAQWIIFISAIVYQIAMNISYLPVTYMLMVEVSSFEVKTITVCLCNIVISVSLFTALNYFDYVASILTYKFLFYLCAVVTIITGILYTTFIPKTRKKSLLEIQVMFKNNQQVWELIELESGELMELSDD